MKSLLSVGVLILTIFSFAKSECDESSQEGLKHCITDIFTALNKTLAHVAKHKGPKFEAIDERSCKIHGEEAKCLKEYEENCLNIETFTKCVST
uniref:Uncharacterized protein n=1 Tax=Panagrolaimus sp. ES5 TaxID=591445 RepID=A0AC34GKZ5_9BILA